jgi:hypothetical protein
MVKAFVGVELMTKAFAPELKTMLLTSVLAENETLVVLETPKVAVSLGPLGTVDGVQLPAVFQSPLAGLRFQLALPANADPPITADRDRSERKNRTGQKYFILLVQPKRGVEGK